MSQEKIKNALQKFGLTGKEAETFILLGKNGPMKGLDIAKQMKRNKGQVYRLLMSLQKRGLVESTLESPTRFIAVSFEKALDMFAEAKRDEAALIEETTKDLISDWKKIGKTKIERTLEKFVVINGTRKTLQKISEMIKETRNQLWGILTVQELIRIEQMGLLDAKFGNKEDSKVEFRFVTDISGQNVKVIKPLLEKIIPDEISIKERNPDLGFKLTPRLVIRDNEEMLLSITSKTSDSDIKESDISLWTNCQSLIQSFASIFEELWRNSTKIKERIEEIDSKVSTIRTSILDDSEKIKQKFEQVILNADNEIIGMITSENLNSLWENKELIKKISKKNVSIKIMTPLITDNIEASIQLSKIGEVRHVPDSYLETFVVDMKHFFQFKIPALDQKEPNTRSKSIGTFYSDNPTHVEKISNILNHVWKTARPPSIMTLESIIGSNSFRSNISYPPLQRVKNVTVISKKLGHSRSNDLENKFRSYSQSATAVIYPPKELGVPDLLIMIDHMQERSSFGKGNSLMIYLKIKLPDGHFFIPAGGIGDIPRDVELRKKLQFCNNEARNNFRLVKRNQLQVRVQDNSLFASWTVPILLYPKFTLPPAYLLLEGYGPMKKGSSTIITPTGYVLELESIYCNAFVTFIQSASKYSGPGTDGLFFREVRGTTTPPE